MNDDNQNMLGPQVLVDLAREAFKDRPALFAEWTLSLLDVLSINAAVGCEPPTAAVDFTLPGSASRGVFAAAYAEVAAAALFGASALLDPVVGGCNAAGVIDVASRLVADATRGGDESAISRLLAANGLSSIKDSLPGETSSVEVVLFDPRDPRFDPATARRGSGVLAVHRVFGDKLLVTAIAVLSDSSGDGRVLVRTLTDADGVIVLSQFKPTPLDDGPWGRLSFKLDGETFAIVVDRDETVQASLA